MSGKEKNSAGSGEEREQGSSWKDPDIISKFATAIATAFIGIIGSLTIYYMQESANKTRLYAQLMSEKQKAENEVRLNMFESTLGSFLEEKKGECLIDRIDRQLFELEMLSRNFHESMDLKPLFTHVLSDIVRGIRESNYNAQSEQTQKCIGEFFQKHRHGSDRKKIIKRVRERYLNKLVKIARHITTKQMESINEVSHRIRLSIDLNNTYSDIRPSETVPKDYNCSTAISENGCTEGSEIAEREKCCIKTGNMKSSEFDIFGNDGEKRKFTISSDRSYEQWNQVYITVTTNRLQKEMEHDKDGPKKKEFYFWVSYFDFPLVDNVQLSKHERFSVVLDEIDDEKAELSLLYFPASYAGFKEKSYYQDRVLNNLLDKETMEE